MRKARCVPLLVGVFMASLGASSLRAADGQVAPLLDVQAAMNLALKLAGEATHSHSFSTQAVRFEPSAREWTVPIDAGLDDGSARHFVARVNESTGLACLESPPAAGCVVKEDIHPILVEVRAKAEALAFAKEHPAPDMQGMAEALLRQQMGKDASHQGNTPRARYFVSIPSPDGKGLADLSPEVMARLRQDGIDTHPAGAWKQNEGHVPMDTRLSIGLPVPRADGNYDVSFGYYCGTLCAGWYTAVMKWDGSGWHVVSTVMTAVS